MGVPRTCTVALVSLALLGARSAPAQDAAPSSRLPWTSLSLVARKGPMTATVDLSVSEIDSKEAARDLVTSPCDDGRNPTGTHVLLLEATTDAPFSAPQRSRTWVDSVHGALQAESWQGKSHRRWRECHSGRHAWRWERKGGADRLVGERHRDAPAGERTLPVVEATSLLWLASVGRLDRDGSSMMAAAWSKDGLVAIRLAARERAILPLRADRAGGGIAARRVEIAVVDEDDGEDGESSSPAPFGLRGPISLWLEEGTGLPLVLEGRSAKVGRIRAVNVAAGLR